MGEMMASAILGIGQRGWRKSRGSRESCGHLIRDSDLEAEDTAPGAQSV